MTKEQEAASERLNRRNLIDNFVRDLEGTAREIAKAYVSIPNTPDCGPGILANHFKYGERAFGEVVDRVEGLRQRLGGVDYGFVQYQLQKRL